MKLAAISLTALAMSVAAPAMAQEQDGQLVGPQPGDEKINQLIIYGDDDCPESTEDEIIVCARFGEEERYRIPRNLRSDPNDPKKEAWAQRVEAYEYVAATGIGSCSTAGAGGFTGCGLNAIDAAYAEKAQDPALTFGRLIAEARRKRLAGIDAEAEEVEGAVLAEERAAALKQLQEQANSVEARPGEEADAGPLPQPQ